MGISFPSTTNIMYSKKNQVDSSIVRVEHFMGIIYFNFIHP